MASTDEATLERQSGVALWRQIADSLRHQIANGAFDAADNKLPPEKQLATIFNCNRHTVRAALDALAREGIVEARQGQGTFVLERKRITYPIGRRTRFSEGVANQAASTSGTLLDTGIDVADADIAKALDLMPGDQVVRLETLSRADGRPVSRATSWFDEKRFGTIAEEFEKTRSITKSLKALGVDDYLRRSTQIEAVHASNVDAETLGLSAGAIVLMTTAINADLSGAPIQYSRTRFAADRVRLSIENDI